MNLQHNLVYCLDKAICKSMIACYSQNAVPATTLIHAEKGLMELYYHLCNQHLKRARP